MSEGTCPRPRYLNCTLVAQQNGQIGTVPLTFFCSSPQTTDLILKPPAAEPTMLTTHHAAAGVLDMTLGRSGPSRPSPDLLWRSILNRLTHE